MGQFEDESATLQEITERITIATVNIGKKMQARTQEMEQFSSGPDSTNRNAAKRLITKAANDMDQYVHHMEAEIPLFSQHLSAGMNALIQASKMSIDFTTEGENLEQIKEQKGSMFTAMMFLALLCVLMGLLVIVPSLREAILAPAVKVLIDGVAYSSNIIQ